MSQKIPLVDQFSIVIPQSPCAISDGGIMVSFSDITRYALHMTDQMKEGIDDKPKMKKFWVWQN